MTYPEEGLPDRAGQELSNEEKDQIRREFGVRLRELLELTGLSSRELAERYPAYKDSTIRKYTSGRNLPAWDFLRDLLAETARRTGNENSTERASELFAAYRLALIHLGAATHGSDQNSLLLRLFDGEQTLHELSNEISQTRERENQLRAELEELRAATEQADPVQVARLEQESQELAGRHRELAVRRRDLLGDLDRSRQHLSLIEAADQATEPAAGLPSLPPAPPTTHVPSLPSASSPTHRQRALRVFIAVVAAAALVGGGTATGIWITSRGHADDKATHHTDPTKKNTPSPPPTTPSPTPSLSRSPSPHKTPKPITMLLTKLDPVAYGKGELDVYNYLYNGSGTVGNTTYDYGHALVTKSSSKDPRFRCQGWSEYNLSGKWQKLTMLIGIDDESADTAAAITVTLDGKPYYEGEIQIGNPAHLSIDVTDVLRLRIAFDDDDDGIPTCTRGDIVVGNPTLSRAR